MAMTSSLIICRRSHPVHTEVFNTYWKFAAERQEIFFRRFYGEKEPWTKDPVLAEHKFTNAYRASDRVSQFLINNVIYADGEKDPKELFFRIILFKLFNKIETWRLLLSELGNVSYRDYSFRRYDTVLSRAMERGGRIYSAAYIMPSGSKIFETDRKHRAHLKLLELMMKDHAHTKITDASTMGEAFAVLRAYPMIGDFLAYQYVTDLNYSPLTNFSEMEFVVPGPGAKDGIRKCFPSLGDWSEADVIRMVTENQEMEFAKRGINFKRLWGRELQLIDCQNLFCEVDKYARVMHPEFLGKTQRTKIKQKFRSTQERIYYSYPPKWGINHLIPSQDFQGNGTLF